MSVIKGLNVDSNAAKRWDRIFKYMTNEPLKIEDVDDFIDAIFDLTDAECDEVVADIEDRMRSEGRSDEINAIHEAVNGLAKIIEEKER